MFSYNIDEKMPNTNNTTEDHQLLGKKSLELLHQKLVYFIVTMMI